jgi:hypothetical protein
MIATSPGTLIARGRGDLAPGRNLAGDRSCITDSINRAVLPSPDVHEFRVEKG